jgi:hypothetical protein
MFGCDFLRSRSGRDDIVENDGIQAGDVSEGFVVCDEADSIEKECGCGMNRIRSFQTIRSAEIGSAFQDVEIDLVSFEIRLEQYEFEIGSDVRISLSQWLDQYLEPGQLARCDPTPSIVQRLPERSSR